MPAGQITQQMVAIAPGRFGSPNAYGNGVGTFQRGTDLYIVCSNPGYGQSSWRNADVDTDPPPILAQAHVLKSQDGGATWVEVDENNGPQVSLQKSTTVFRGLTSPISACYQDGDTLLVGYFVWDYTYNDPVDLRFSTFDMSTDTWGAEVAGGPTSETVANLSMAFRAGDGAIVFLYDGLETVGTPFSRMFYVVYNAGWGAEAPIDVAQTGSTDNYNMAGAVAGDSDRTHLFYRTDVGGTSNLLQSTLTALDALIAAVTITSDVDTAQLGVPPKFAPWGTPVARQLFGVGITNLFIPYIKDTTVDLNFSHAVSADSPVFAEVTIGGTNCRDAGIFNCGPLIASQGLAAATQENTNNQVVSGSQDVATWESFTPVTVPQVDAEEIINYFGLGILSGDGGFYSAGIVANSLLTPPE